MQSPPDIFDFFRLRRQSLARGIVLSMGAFLLSMHLAGFPDVTHLHGSLWQTVALVLAVWGMAETGRCIRKRWSLYHAGVILLLYTDLMIVAMVAFFLFVL